MQLFLGQIKKINKVVIVILATIVSLVIFLFLIYLPQREEIAILKARHEAQKQKINIIQDFVKVHPETEKLLMELDGKVITANKMLPENPEMAELLGEVQRLSQEIGVSVYQFKPQAPIQKNGYREIPVELALSGSYFHSIEFVKKLEGVIRFNIIKQVNVQSKNGMLDSKISLVIFCNGGQPTDNNTKASQQNILPKR